MNKYKNQAFRKFLAFVLSAVMVITYMPAPLYTFAETDGAEPAVSEELESKTEPAEETKQVESQEQKEEVTEEADKTEVKAEEKTEDKAEETPANDPPAETTDGESVNSDDQEQTSDEIPADDVASDDAKTDDSTGSDVDTGEDAKEEDVIESDKADDDEDLKYPKLEANKTVNGVMVNVIAPEGTAPEGTEISIGADVSENALAAIREATGAEDPEVHAVDISLTKDGEEVELKGDVSVSMQLVDPDSELEYTLMRFDGNGAGIINDASFDGIRAEFKTTDLSVYAIVGAKKEGEPEPEAEAEAETETAPTVKTAPKKAATRAAMITVTFDPTTDPKEPLAHETIEVESGSAIGDKLPTVPEVPGYRTKWVKEGTTTEVTAETVVTEEFTAVVAKEKIIYTVTFVQEDGSEETRTTSIDDGFAVNDLPAVAPKTNKIGKWVYPGTTNEFTVGTVISGDVTVNAYYEQNIFTVTYKVDDAVYEELTTASGTTIVLPSDPIKKGATFSGWFTEPDGEGTQYTATSTVNQDLTLYAYFADQVRVAFIVKDKDGNIISEKSQYFVDLTTGDQITTLPDEPFIEGKVFDHWENEKNGDTVGIGYTVTESFNAVAVFKDIDSYELTVRYFYKNDNGEEVTIGTQVYDLVESDFQGDVGTYTVTAPGYTIATQVTDEPTYYPSRPTITVSKLGFILDEESGKYIRSEEDEFVAADAEYKVGHYLKDLNGDGYTLIESIDKVGVKNSKVTPDINSYAYAEYEDRDEDVTITGNAGQELKVYYTRREFTLSYNVNGGDYVPAKTDLYGTSITLPTSATRAGYTFVAWYKDKECTQPAGNSIVLEGDTTLYAKWNAAQVNYKIVYMVENADDDGYSFLKDVTRQAATDATLTLTKAQADSYAPNDLDKQNFTFKESTTEKIKADGSSVIVVKYTRNVYTINWNGDVYRTNGNRRAQNQGSGSVTAKYGATITPQWVAAFNDRYPNFAWSPTTRNNDKVISIDTMPGRGDSKWTFDSNNVTQVKAFDFSTTKTQTLNYWLENYTGEGVETKTRDGKTYGLYKSVTGKFNYLYDDADFYPISGYSKDGYEAKYITQEREWVWDSLISGHWEYHDVEHNYTLGSGTPDADLNVDFYYAAATHHLVFYNYDGTLLSDQEVKLNADISGYLSSNIPSAPKDKDTGETITGTTWLGWFTDAEHNEPYDGGTKMPAGLVLYGNFQFPTRTVSYDSQGGSDVSAETKEYGFYATKPADPTRAHYDFLGWFTEADESGSPYDWNQPVTKDIKLYAHWSQEPISYTVHYYEKGSTTKVLEDKVVSDPDFKENQEITEYAPTVAGHIADEGSKKITLSFDEEANTIIFYYDVIPDELSYTVRYVLKDHPDIAVAKEKPVTVPGSTANVMEMAKDINGEYFKAQVQAAKAAGRITEAEAEDILGKNYKPTKSSQELLLGLDNNVITFEYISYTTTTIKVNYLDMDGNSIEVSDTAYVEKGDTFTVQNKAPAGYVYHHAYLDGTTTAPQATYQITGNEGNLVINIYYQKKLIIIANNKSKSYDGTALFSSFENPADYTVTGNMRGDTLESVEFDGSQTDAGTSATTPKNAQISKGTQGITDPETYYSIIYVPGSLTVKPVSVYISISADQWNTHSGGSGPNYYTGQTFNVGFTNQSKQHFNDAAGSAYVSITSGQRALFKEKYGDAIWSALYGSNGALISEKNAGSYSFTGEQQKARLAAVTVGGQAMMADPNYTITIFARDSFLKIEPLPLTITTPSDEKTYDGTELTKSEGATLDHSYWTENIGGNWTAAETAAPGQVTLGTGDTITFEVTGSRTDVGDSDNTYNIKWGATESSNYRINATLGTLTVTQGSLEVAVKDIEKVYNGYEQEGRPFVATITGTGETITTDNYTVKGLGKGDVLKIEYTPASGKDVSGSPYTGSFAASYTLENAKGDDVRNNYSSIEFKPGKLTITKKDLTITAKTQTYTYDGAPHGPEGTYTEGLDTYVTVDGLAGEDALTSITLSGSKVNAGTYKDEIVPSAAKIGTSTGNYEIRYVKGDLVIDQSNVKIVVVPGSGEKVYDGTALTKTAHDDFQVTGVPEGFTWTAAADGTVTNVTPGEGEKAVNAVTEFKIFNAAGEDVTDQFANIDTSGKGSLKINPRPITIKANNANNEYTGSTVTYATAADAVSPFYTITSGSLVNGQSITAATLTGAGVDTGTYPINITEGSVEIGDNTANYAITLQPGTLTITQNTTEIIVKPGSGSKVYDGTALTKTAHDDFTVTGVPEGFTWTAKADGTVTNVTPGEGEKAVNAVTEFKIFNADGDDVTDQFSNIDKSATGTLTITARPITIKANDAQNEYTGSTITYATAAGAEEPYYTITNGGLVDGQSITAITLNGEGVEKGTYPITITEGSVAIGENTANYAITLQPGTLTITQNSATIVVIPGSGSKTYDGTALTKTAHDDFTVTGVPDGFTWTATADGTVTNVTPGEGEKAVNAVTEFKIFNGDGEDVTAQFANIDKTATGTLTITARPITIKANDANNEYTGSTITYATASDAEEPYYTISDGSLASGQTITAIELTGEGVEKGEYDITITEGSVAIGDHTPNYAITLQKGTLTISQNSAKIKVVPADGEKVYDGTALTKTEHDDFTVTGVPEGFTWTAKADGTVTNVTPGEGEKAVNAVTEFKIFNGAGKDVTEQFAGIDTTATGTLTIKPRPIELTANDANNEYTGSTITYSTAEDAAAPYYTISGGSLASGQSITSIALAGEGVAVGKYPITITEGSVAIGNNTANYTITLKPGTLTISQNSAEIVVKPGSGSKTYDGTALTKNEHDDFTVTGVPEGFTWTAKADGTVTNVTPGEGEKAVNAVTEFRILDANGQDVTAQFANIDTSATGTLTITARPITIKANDANNEYTGSTITYATASDAAAPYYTISSGSLADGQSITSIALKGEGIESGEYPITITDGSVAIGENTANYTITLQPGTLTISQSSAEIVVVPGSGSKVYDGTALTKTAHDDFQVTGVPEGFTWTASADGTVTNVTPGEGEKAVNAVTSFKIFNAAGEDVTDQFANIDKSATGTLLIIARPITLKANDASNQYTGRTITYATAGDAVKPYYTVTNQGDETGLADGQSVTAATLTGEGVAAGTYPITITEGSVAIGDYTDNYTITLQPGTLTITQSSAEIVVVPGSGSKVYDGTALTKTEHDDFTVSGVPDGFTWTATADGTVTNVTPGEGEKAVNAVTSFKIFNAAGEEVTDQFSGINTDATGTLTIDPRPITIEANNASNEYTGSTITYATASDAEKPYYTISSGSLADGQSITAIELTGEGVEKGEYPITVTEGSVAIGNYTPNYTITLLPGTLTISQNSAEIKVVPADGEKVYDGTALTKTEHDDFTVTGVPDGFTWTATADGTVTNVTPGTNEKAVNAVTSFKIFNADSEDVTDQFANIDTSATGTLTIKPRPIELTANDANNEYTGSTITYATAQNAEEPYYTITSSGKDTGLADGQTITAITLNGEGIESGEYPIAITEGSVAIGENTANYDITLVSGTLTISKSTVAIRVVPGSGEKVYDGTALTKTAHDDFTVTGVPEGFTWTAAADGTVTNVSPGEGEKVENGVTDFKIFNADGEDVTSQFENIEKSAKGLLKVTARPITIKANDASNEYTGSTITYATAADAVSPYYKVTNQGDESGLAPNQSITAIKLTGEGVDAGEYDINITKGSVEIGDYTDNYKITLETGTLTISQNSAEIVVVPGSGNKVYDGTALTKTEKDDFTVTGVPEGFTWTAKADGTVTNVTPGTDEKAVNAVTEFKIFNAAGDDVTDQFSNIDKSATGTLTITARPITIKANDAQNEYTGSKITYETAGNAVSPYYTVTNTAPDEGLAPNQSITAITLSGEGVATGTYPITITEGSIAIGDYTDNYSITLQPGTLTITQNSATIVVVPGSGSKTYDGTALTKTAHDDFTVTGVPDGFTWTAAADGTVTNVTPGEGEKAVNAVTEFKIFNAAGEDVTSQFASINTDATGTLTITARPITIKANDANNEYTGSTITYATAADAVSPYYTVTNQGENTGLADGQSITVAKLSGQGIEKGEYDITITEGSVAIGDHTPNYAITLQKGTLTITQNSTAIKVVPGSGSKVYDGTALTKTEHDDFTVTGVPEGFTWTATADGTVTNVTPGEGEKAVNAVTSFKIFNGDGEDVTSQFANIDTTATGTLTIKPRSIELTANDANNEYTGSTITYATAEDAAAPYYTISGGSLAPNQSITSIALAGEGVAVGKYPIAITEGSVAIGNNTANYTITLKPGTLTISQNSAEIVVKPGSGSKTYDGTALTKTAHDDFTVTGVPEGFTWTAKADGTVTNVTPGEDEKAVNAVTEFRILDANGQDVTTQFANIDTSAKGTLTITARPITLKANDANNEYTGSSITYATAGDAVSPYYTVMNTASDEGLAPNQSITSITLTGEGIESGDYPITITEGSVAIGDNTANYTITLQPGTLTISQSNVEIVVVPGSGSKVYDGTALTKTAHDDFTVTGVPEGFAWTATADGTVTNVTPGAGEKAVNAVTEFKIFNADGEDVTNQFANIDTSAIGALEITARPITIKANDAQNEYTGSKITYATAGDAEEPYYTVTNQGENTGLADGQSITAATLTGEGIKAGTYTIEITEGSVAIGDYTDNYTITLQTGTLTIKASSSEIVVVPGSDSKVYDGTALTKTDHDDFKVTGVPEGFTWTATADGTVTNVTPGEGEKAVNAVTSFKIFNADGEEVTEQFSSINTDATGTLTIDPRPITIKANNAVNEYTGSTITYATASDAVEPYYTINSGSLASGQSITAIELTGQGVEKGEYPITITEGSVAIGDHTSNYAITLQKGTLTITQNTEAITVVPGSGSKVYDGTALTKTAHDDFTVTGVPEGFTWTAAADGTVTNVTPGEGEKAVNAITEFKIFNGDGEDVTEQFANIDTSATGTLTIAPKAVTLTSGDAKKAYDGNALTNADVEDKNENGLTVEAGWVEGEGATYEFTGSQIVKGESPNAFSYTLKAGTKADNYTITKNEGKLEITASTKALVIESSSKSWTYDGKVHTDEVYTVTYDGKAATADETGKVFTLSTGDTLTITPTAEGVKDFNAKYSKNNTYNYVLSNADSYSDVTANVGTLSIDKKAVTLTSGDAEKAYDGTALTNADVEDKNENGLTVETGWVEGEGATYEFTGGQTVKGESPNAFSYTLKAGTLADNYTISKNEGTLKVTESTKELKVVSKDGNWTYDGDAHTKYEYTVTYGDESYDVTIAEGEESGTATLSTGDVVTVTPSGSATITNVTKDGVTNAFTYRVTNNDQYSNQTKTEGKLTIDPRAITLKSNDAEKEYDGTELTDTRLTQTGKFVEGEDITVAITGTITEVGQTVNTIAITALEEVLANYAIDKQEGTLKIKASTKALKVVSKDGSWTYDGDAHTKHEYTVTYGDESYDVAITEGAATGTATLSTGDVVTISPAESAAITHAAETPVDNAFSYEVQNSSFYANKSKEEGKLTVTPATLTIKTESASREYNGKALTADGSIDGFVKEETATFTVTGSQTEVGKSDNTYSLVWDGTAAESDYTLSKDIGELEVTASTKTLKVVSKDGSWTYDGDAHTKHEYTVTYGDESYDVAIAEGDATGTATLSTGDKVTITPAESAAITHAAESPVTNAFSYEVEHSSQYSNKTKEEGSLKVTPATLTVRTESASRAYNGKALTADGSIDGFVKEETATFTVTGSQTTVGESDNTYTLKWDGTAVESDYRLSETIGKLKVTESTKELKVVSKNGSWTYDGDAHTKHEYTVTYGDESYDVTIAEGEETGTATLSTGDVVTITPAESATITHAAESSVTNAFSYTVAHGDQYAIKAKEEGSLSVTPATLTATTESASRAYNGKDLTAAGSISGFVTPTGGKQETATFTVTGKQRTVGSSTNTYEITWNGTAVETDYTISPDLGTLTVTANDTALKIVSKDGSWTYDGNAHTKHEYTVSYGDESYDVTIAEGEESGAATLSTGDVVTITPSESAAITHVAETTVDNAFSYEVTNGDQYSSKEKEEGTLSVIPAELIIATNSAERAYNGEDLTADGTISGFVTPTGGKQETATFTVTGKQNTVGESDNTYTLTWDGTAVESDYTLVETIGKLKVTESTIELKVVSADGKWTYDGKEHSKREYTVTYGSESYTVTVAEDEETGTVTLSTGDVVTITPDASARITNVKESDVTNAFSYEVTNSSSFGKKEKAEGKLTIDPRAITLKSNDAEKEYDGTALTDTRLTQTGKFVEGEDITVAITGTITEVGQTVNTIAVTALEEVLANYAIEKQEGTLKIKASTKALKVVSKDGSWTYDGDAHAKHEYTVTYGDESYDVTIAEGTATGTATLSTGDVVTITPAESAAITHAAESSVTNAFSYAVEHSSQYSNKTKEEGSLRVTPATLTVRTESASRAYNGKALTADGSINGFVKEETATFTVTGSQTAVGSSENGYMIDWDGTAVETDYTIEEDLGTLTVSASTTDLKVISKNGSFTYDGNAHTKYEYTVSYGDESYDVAIAEGEETGTATLSTGDKVTITPAKSATITHVAETTVGNAFAYTVDNSDHYSSQAKEEGKLTVTPATLTITTNSATREYNGKELTAEGSISGFVKKETATFTVTGSQTTVGESDNTYTLTWDGTAVESDYKLSETIGKLKVTESTKELKVVSKNGSWTYDGDAHTKHEYTVTYGDESYDVTIAEGDATGTATLSTGDKVTITPDASASITNVRESDVTNAFSYEVTNSSSFGKKEKTEGKLTITARPVTFSAVSETKEYTSKTITINGLTVSSGEDEGLVSGHTHNVKFSASGTEVGEYNGTITAKSDVVIKSGETDVTANYDITVENGKLTIEATGDEFQISLADDEYVYDAKPHYNKNTATSTAATGKTTFQYRKAAAEGEPENEWVDDLSSLTVRNVGDSCTIEVRATNPNYSKTATTTTKLTVTKRSVTLTSETAEKPYDGTPLTKPNVTVSGDGFVEGEATGIKATGSVTTTAEGEVTNTITYTESDSFIADNYNITKNEGKLKITPAELPKDPDDPKDPKGNRFQATVPEDVVYNGKAQKQPIVVTDTLTGKVLTEDDITIEYSDDVTNVGTVRITIKAKDGGNYIGSFTRSYRILPAELTIKADDKTKIYGTADPKLTASVVKGQLFGADTLNYDISRKKGENVGRYTITVKEGSRFVLRLFAASASNYKVTYLPGTLTITPAPLTITTGSATKVYDGTALTSATASIVGLVNGDAATVRATGQQTAVGSSDNTYSINWTKGSENNYTITEQLGTLTVTRAGGGGGTPQGGGNNITPAPAPGPAPAPAPDDEPEVIPDEPTPEVEPEVIPDDPTPAAEGTWALINLISAILTTLGAAIALFRRKEEDDEDDGENQDKAKDKNEDEEDGRGRKMLASKIAGAIAGIAAPIVFILTEDMTLPMAMTDKWTLLMIVMLAAQIIAASLNKKASELDDEEEEATEA